MNTTVKGKNLDVGDALRGHVEENVSTAVSKYFSRALDANVVFSKEGHQFRAEIAVHPGRGLVVHGGGDSNDPYAAFEVALERISKQLRRYHRRITNHHKRRGDDGGLVANQYVVQAEPEHEELPADGQPTIIAELPTEIPALSVSEAVMRMDLADSPVQMFRDSGSGRLNVVYRRTDGNIGWIDPSESAGS